MQYQCFNIIHLCALSKVRRVGGCGRGILFQQKMAASLHEAMFSVISLELHICSGLTCEFYFEAAESSLHIHNRTDSFVLSFHLFFQISLFHFNFPQSYSLSIYLLLVLIMLTTVGDLEQVKKLQAFFCFVFTYFLFIILPLE